MMSGNGDATLRELILQQTQNLSEFKAETKAELAALSVKMDVMKDSCAVMNHNSTLMVDRISKLESVNRTSTDFKDFAKRIGITLGGVAAFVATLLTILSLLGVVL